MQIEDEALLEKGELRINKFTGRFVRSKGGYKRWFDLRDEEVQAVRESMWVV